ncbi:MAG: PLDc_N domain-containing protein [Ruminococcus sp.]|nr:PLDc_N domain-containing protein [Ruminococcus sp.]
MDEIREYLPFIIPLAIIQFGLMIASLVHIFKHDKYKVGNRALWVVICLLVSIIGPVAYFAVGKEDS